MEADLTGIDADQLQHFFEVSTCIVLMDSCSTLKQLEQTGRAIRRRGGYAELTQYEQDALRGVYRECRRAIKAWGGTYRELRKQNLGFAWSRRPSTAVVRALKQMGYEGDPWALSRDEAIQAMQRLRMKERERLHNCGVQDQEART